MELQKHSFMKLFKDEDLEKIICGLAIQQILQSIIDPVIVESQYYNRSEAFLKMKTMPSFSNDKGNAIILNEQGNITDEVNYSDKWHFPLLNNTKGFSVERIDYNGASGQNNFHSAAISSGYRTAGFKNSQYKSAEELRGEITFFQD